MLWRGLLRVLRWDRLDPTLFGSATPGSKISSCESGLSMLGDVLADTSASFQPVCAHEHEQKCVRDSASSTTGRPTNIRSPKGLIEVDARSPSGLNLLQNLILEADVVMENNALGAMDRLGLGADDVIKMIAEKRPEKGIIYSRSNAYGFEGPFAPAPGYEHVAVSFLARRAVGYFMTDSAPTTHSKQ